MSDSLLRDLERRWLASGATVDELAFLAAKVRTAGLTWSDLCRLASLEGEVLYERLGDRGVPDVYIRLFRALGLVPGSVSARTIREVAQAIEACGLEASVRSGLSAVEAVVSARLAQDASAVALLACVRSWLIGQTTAPVRESLVRAQEVLDTPALQDATSPVESWGRDEWARVAVSNLAYLLARGVEELRLPRHEDSQLAVVLEMSAGAMCGARTTDPAGVCARIISEVGPWIMTQRACVKEEGREAGKN